MVPRIVRSKNAAMIAPRTMRIRRCSLFRRASRKAIDSARELVIVLLPTRVTSRSLFHFSTQMTSLTDPGQPESSWMDINQKFNRKGGTVGSRDDTELIMVII